MKFDQKQIKKSIEAALNANAEGEEIPASEISFHLTDWLDDLRRLQGYFNDPDSLAPDEIEKLLYDFLLHVPNHLAAASKLLCDTPVSDIFEVGAIECEHNVDANSEG